MTNSSLATIGQQCGKKDHATVLHACRTINNLIDTDPKFRANVEEIHKKIQI
ncbi:MAG: helix-turn-helix domain-containing protein [Bacteroidales bacterium]|nr:helix-turn-helix domain-containing protein [Bacteroidales bacterium]